MTMALALALALAGPARASALAAHDDAEFCNFTIQRNFSSPVPASNTTLARMGILMEWCVSDPECADAFRLDPLRPDLGVFTHLIPGAFVHRDLLAPLADIVCRAEVSAEDAARQLWLRWLTSFQRTQEPLCDIDHKPWIDPQTHEQQCVCLPDRPCGQVTNSPTALYVVYGLLMTIAAGLLVLSVLRNTALVRTLSKRTNSEIAGLRALFAAAKG